MEWRKVPFEDHYMRTRQHLPLDAPFLGMWRGNICLMEFSEEDTCFFAGFSPAIYEGVSRIDLDRECRISHVMEITRPND